MRRITVAAATLAMLLLLAAQAPGALAQPAGPTRVVDDDGLGSPTDCNANVPAFTTIQAAVTAAAPGNTVLVCPGTYTEQVTIPASKNDLTLRSVGLRTAIIRAPAVMADPGDIVRVNGARRVTITRFTITGPLPDSLFCSLFARTGIQVDGGGSATITDNLIKDIRAANQAALGGCQNGFGVLAGDILTGQVGTATVRGNTFETYQKGGIVFANVGPNLSTVANNTFDGGGPSPIIARNGIQISDGAVVTAEANTIRNHRYTTDPTAASGIIVFETGGGNLISGNIVELNDDNIALYAASGIIVFRNTASNSTKYDGLYASSDSSRNVFRQNVARNNALFDCEDDSTGGGTAGTANSWLLNDGFTSDPPGLCTGAPPPAPNGNVANGAGVAGSRIAATSAPGARGAGRGQ